MNAPQFFRLTKKLLAANAGLVRDYRERRSYHCKPLDYWERLPELVLQETSPVFFLSTGRCGTALLTTVFERLGNVLCHHAPRPELLYSERLAYEQGAEQFEAYKTAILAARFEMLADCLVRGNRYVETNYRVTFFAPHLAALLPRAKFIHLVRHPGAFVTSAVRSNYYLGQYTDIGRIRPVRGETVGRWSSMSHLEKCAWLWNETNQFIEAFKTQTDSSRIMTVKSESLFEEPEKTADILDFCQLEPPSLDTIKGWISRPINAQTTPDAFPSFKHWKPAQKETLRAHCPLAGHYGYAI